MFENHRFHPFLELSDGDFPQDLSEHPKPSPEQVSGPEGEHPNTQIQPVIQVIFAFHGDPEDYVRTDAHLKVRRPSAYPNCMESGVLRALGYYSRWVSSNSQIRTSRISVRLFRCYACRLSTSMLQDFALPYRLVATDTVEQYLGDLRSGETVTRPCHTDKDSSEFQKQQTGEQQDELARELKFKAVCESNCASSLSLRHR